jgi:sugar/nucleoside kinase (ribokinase family)
MSLDDAHLSPTIDFLSVGHICYDLTPGGKIVGGAAAYTAAIADALGCRTAVVTSAAPADDWQPVFPQLLIHQKHAESTTVFENIDTPQGRIQTIHAVASCLTHEDIPTDWLRASIVYLGPIANEVDPRLVQLFSNSMLGIGPQGWLRRWHEDGRVFHVPWEDAAVVVPLAAVTFLSMEDLARADDLTRYQHLAKILVVTDGRKGCTVYFHNEERSFPAVPVEVEDTTGAGDIFAAAYLIRLSQTNGDVWESAKFANQIAARSVKVRGLPDKIIAIRHLVAAGVEQV